MLRNRRLLLIVLFIQFFVQTGFSQTGPGGVGDKDTYRIGGLPGDGLSLWVIADSAIFDMSNGVTSLPNLADVAALNMDGLASGIYPTYVTGALNGHAEISFGDVVDALESRTMLDADSFPTNTTTIFYVLRHDNNSQRSSSYRTGTSGTNGSADGSNRVGTHNPWNGQVISSVGECGCAINSTDDDGRIVADYEDSWVGQYGIWISKHSPSEKTLYRDTIIAGPVTINSGFTAYNQHAADNFYLGHSSNDNFQGDLAEMIMFNTELNDAQIEVVRNYLAAKYDLSIETDYYLFQSSHGVDVAGIGQSGTDVHDGAFSSTLGIGNADALDDGDFIIFGHDNESIASWVTDDQPLLDSNFVRINREWRFDVTNIPGAVNIAIDTADLPAKPTDFDYFYLWLDNDGDFTTGATAFPLTLNDSVYQTSNVTISDGQFATIALYRPVVNFSDTTLSVVEGAAVNYQIEIPYATYRDIVIDYAVSGTSEDVPVAGSLTIDSAQTTETLIVPTSLDTDPESDETIILELSSVTAVGALVGSDSISTAFVNDDDNAENRTIEFLTPCNYGYSRDLTILSSEVSGSSDFTDYVMLVAFDDSTFLQTSEGKVQNTSGFDIRFTYKDSLSFLEHQIERYDGTEGDFIAWVKLPTLSATSDTELTMYYGNADITEDPSTENVWSDYSAVYHFENSISNDQGNATFDASAVVPASETFTTSGRIGTGIDFPGTNDEVIEISNTILPAAGEFSVSFWYYPTATPGVVFDVVDDQGTLGAPDVEDRYFFYDFNGSQQRYWFEDADDDDMQLTLSQAPTINGWNFITLAGEWNSSSHQLFSNANDELNVVSLVGPLSPNTPLRIGGPNIPYVHENTNLTGFLDELRIINRQITQDEHLTNLSNQGDPGNFYSLGAESANACSLSESVASIEITIGLNTSDTDAATTVSYQVTGGDALEGTDFTLSGSNPISIAAGDSLATFTIDIINDLINENNESFTVSLFSPTNANLGSNSMFTYTIEDDDSEPILALADTAVAINEGSSINSAVLTLSSEAGTSINVDYVITGITAVEDEDYVLADGTLTIPAGTSSQELNFNVIDDNVIEAQETFAIKFSNAVNASIDLDYDSIVFTINDNDDFGIDGPGGIGNADGTGTLSMWMIADSATVSGSDVTAWENEVGISELNMTPPLANPSFVPNAKNGHAEISFANVNDVLTTDSRLSTAYFPYNEASTFIVTRHDNLTQFSNTYGTSTTLGGGLATNRFSAHMPWGGQVYYDIGQCCGTDGRSQFTYDTDWVGEYTLFSYTASGTEGKIARANSVQQDFDAGTDIFQDHSDFYFNIGQTQSSNFQGDVLEFILFTSPLNDAQVIIMENYLAAKYDLTIANDLFSFSTTHNFDVVGIGYEDADNFHLSAKANVITLSNASELGSGEYVFAGHNNELKDAWTTTEIPTGFDSLRRVEREWRFDITGSPGTISVAIDSAKLPVKPSGYADYILMVDEDGDFTNNATIYSTSLVDGEYVANDIVVSQGSYLTIGVLIRKIDFSSTFANVLETASSNLTIELNQSYPTDLSIDYAVKSGTATQGDDYSLATTGSVTIFAGSTSATINPGVIDESVIEGDETIVVALRNAPNATFLGADSLFTYTITDDDNTRDIEFRSITDYGFKKVITVDATQVNADLTDFPFYFTITNDSLRSVGNGGNIEDTNGYDIGFTLADSVDWLQHDLEYFDPVTGTFVVWVKIPDLSSSENTLIDFYYGNNNISFDYSSSKVWDSYEGVYHFDGDVTDASINERDGTNNQTTDVAGLFGQGRDFDGASDFIDLSGDIIPTTGEFTISFWYNPDVVDGNDASLFDMGNDAIGKYFISDYSSSGLRWWYESANDADVQATYGTAPSIGTWSMVMLTGGWDDNDHTIYEGGALRVNNTTTVDGSFSPRTNFRLGASLNELLARVEFDGQMDEFRVYAGRRSLEYHEAEFVNQNTPAAFYSVATQDTVEVNRILEDIDEVEVSVSIQPVDNANPTTATYTATGGTAINGQDYTLSSGTVTVPAGSQTGSFTLSIINDLSDESDETIEITLSNPSSNTKIGANSTTTFTIEDDDGLPTISFVDTVSTANEGTSLVPITLELNIVSGNDVSVDYAVTAGDAIAGTDYIALSGTATITAGDLTTTISFQPIDDADIEIPETVEITISNPLNGTLVTDFDIHTVTIADNDDLGFEGPGGVGDVENVLGENLLKLWLIADSVNFSGSSVTSWDNLIKNVSVDYDMVPASTAPDVVDNAVNGHKEISFNNVSDALVSEGILSAASFPGNEMSFFVVTETDNLNQDSYTYATDNSANGAVDANSISASIPNGAGNIEFDIDGDNFSTAYLASWAGNHSIFTHIVSSDTFLVYRNNNLQVNRNDANPSFTGHTAYNFYLGKNGAVDNYQGDIAEVIMFSRDVNVAQSNIINNYLAAKYNLTITNDYYNFEVSHGVEVAGIGRVNLSNQHVAARAGIVTISNANDLDDGEYVFFGHDNGDVSTWTASEIPTSGILRTAREWRFDNTGSPGTIGIAINADLLPALPNGDEDYIIIQDADGDFTSGASVINTVLVDGQYKASDLTIESGDYVTFGIATRTVSFSPTALSGSETVAANATILLSLESSENITVDYEITDGTATGGNDDYGLAATGQVTFIAGQTSANLALGIINDSDVENDETIEITLSNPPTGVSLSDSVFTYTINDDDNSRNVQFNVDNSAGAESVTDISLQVDLNSADPSNDTKVYYAITGGTAEASPAPDYVFTADTLTIAATETTGTVDFTILDDVLSEDTETIEISLSSPINANLGTNVTHTYSITDNDGQVTVEFQDATTTIDEGGSIAQIVVELSATSGQDVSVDYAVTGGTATGGGTDYSLSSGTLLITAGNQLGTINVALTDDGVEESAETIEITISGEVGAILGSQDVHTITLSDNDAAFGYYGPGGVGDNESTMLWLDATAINGKGVANVTDGASVTTWVDRSGNGNDFTAIGAAPTFDVDAFNLKNTVVVSNSVQGFQSPGGFSNALSNYSFVSAMSQTSGDYLVENNTAATGIFRLGQGSTSLYSLDGVDGPISASTSEDITTWLFDSQDGSNTAQIFRNGVSVGADNNFQVMAINDNFALGSRDSDQTQGAADFGGNISEFIVYRNVLNDAQRIIVENYLANKYDLTIPNDYYAYEGTYGFDVVGLGRTNDEQHLQSMSDSLLMISGPSDLNNDEYVFIGHDNGDDLSWTTTEAPSGGSNVRRLAREWRTDITGSPGTIILMIDTLTLPDAPAGFDQYVVWTDDDGDFRSGATTYQVEYSEIFGFHVSDEVTVAAGTYITIGVGQPVIQFSLSESNGDETVTNPGIEVALNFTLGADATVNYAATGGTASGSNVDYLLESGTITIAEGQSTANISLGIIDDAIQEGDETIEITLTTPSSNVALGGTTVHTYTINDNDNAEGRTVTFNVAGPGAGAEATAGTPIQVQVDINTPDDDVATTVDVLVVTTGPNAAEETDDFTLSTSTVTFPADNTTVTQTFDITVVDDAIFEGTETVTLQLTNPVNADLGGITEYTLDITDDDSAPVAGFTDASSFIGESGGTASIEVSLDMMSVNDVTIDYTVMSTATSGADFTLDNGSLLILAGEISENIQAVIVNDLVTESAETITITLTGGTNATVGGTTVHVLTINDDDLTGSTGPGGVGDDSGNLLWLIGDNYAGSTWTDVSGNNNDFTGSVSTGTLNNQTTIALNGTQSLARASSISGESDYDIFTVTESSATSDQIIFLGEDATNDLLLGFEHVSGAYQDQAGFFEGSEIIGTNPLLVRYNLESGSGLAEVVVDGTVLSTGIDYTPTEIGANSTVGDGTIGLNGEVGELIVYNSSLNDAQAIIVQNYLDARYNIGIANDFYAHNGASATDFNYNLIGIGREDIDNIHVTATSEEFLVISNPNDLGDGEYLMIANDGQDMTTWTTTGAPANGSTRIIAKDWRVDITGTPGSISFQVDTTFLPAPPENGLTWALVVTNDGDFTNIDATYPLTPVSGDIVGINGLSFADGDYFKIALVEYQSTGTSNDFQNPLAWTTGVVPTAGTNAKIVDGHSLFLSADAVIGSLTLEGTGALDLDGFTLELNDGCIGLNGTGTIDVTDPNSTIAYTNPNAVEQCVTGMTYNNLFTDGPAGSTKYLTGNITVLGNIDLESSGGTGAFFDTRNAGTTDDYNIEIEGNWISEITFLPRTGTVTFDGTLAQTINTLGGETFNNLTINKVGLVTRADSTVTMGSNVTTNGTLTMSSGHVDLSSFDLNVNSGSSISGGNEDSYFIADGVGVLRHAVTSLSTPIQFPIGDSDEYAPFIFTLNSGTLSSSNVTINIRDAKHTDIVEANFITRYWSLENEGITGSIDYDVSYSYMQNDVEGDESSLLPRKFSASGNVYGTSVNTTSNLLSSLGYTTFSDHTGESNPALLPVELISFSGEIVDNKTMLTWATSSEVNNNYFEIQHSIDGIAFETVGVVDGAGNSNGTVTYDFIHTTPALGDNYYRLRQVDFDGKSETHETLRLTNDFIRRGIEALIYPNPGKSNNIKLRLSSGDNHTPVQVKIVDMVGKTYFLKSYRGSLSIDERLFVDEIVPGIYFVEISQGENLQRKKLVIR